MAIEQFKTDEVILSNINQDTIPKQVVMQGEKDGRSLTVQVRNGGVVEPQAGLNLNLGWKHRTAKDKTGELIQGLDAFKPIDRENGIFRIEYTSSMAQPGTIDAEIQFVTSSSVTKSQPFIITVKPSTVDENAVESESSFTVLQEALSHVSQYDEKIEGLELSKAEKKDLQQTQENVSSIAAGKVDKGGVGQVGWGMLDQGARENISSGQIAVVGIDSVADPNVVDESLTRKKLAFATNVSGQIIQGTLNIDLINSKVTISQGAAISNGVGYQWIGSSQEVTFSDSPIYIGFNGSSLVAAKDTTNLNKSNGYLVAVVYQNRVFAHDYKNIRLNNLPVAETAVDGIITKGTITIDRGRTITLTSNIEFSSAGRIYSGWLTEEQVITHATSQSLQYIVADKRTKQFLLVTSVVPDVQVLLATINGSLLVLPSAESKINMLNDISGIRSISAFDINQGNGIVITDTESQKTITISGSRPIIDDITGYYYWLGSGGATLDFTAFPSGSGKTLGIYITGVKGGSISLYCDYFPHDKNDIKFFGYYNKKVYCDDITRKNIKVNGVTNGGWGVDTPSPTPKDEKGLTLSEISNGLADGSISTLCFYGDSTFAGASGGRPDNAFCSLLGPMLSDEFGKTINVINGGHGGKSISWLKDNVDTFFGSGGTYQDAQVVVVGGGLNNGRAASSIESNRSSLQSIVDKLKNLGKHVVIATTQATCLTAFTSDQPPNYTRNQWGVYAYENSMRRDVAFRNNLALLDFNTITSQFLMYSSHLENAICYDRLHFSDIGHKFEAEWLCSQLINRTMTIDGEFFITPSTHNIQSDVEWHAIENLSGVDGNGFKSQIKLDSLSDGVVVFDTVIFNEAKQRLSLSAFTTGNVDIEINGQTYSVSSDQSILPNVEMGFYHIRVVAKGSTGYFKGMKFIES